MTPLLSFAYRFGRQVCEALLLNVELIIDCNLLQAQLWWSQAFGARWRQIVTWVSWGVLHRAVISRVDPFFRHGLPSWTAIPWQLFCAWIQICSGFDSVSTSTLATHACNYFKRTVIFSGLSVQETTWFAIIGATFEGRAISGPLLTLNSWLIILEINNVLIALVADFFDLLTSVPDETKLRWAPTTSSAPFYLLLRLRILYINKPIFPILLSATTTTSTLLT